MAQFIENIQAASWYRDAVASVTIIVLALLIRWLMLRWVKRAPIKSSDLRRRWVAWVQRACIIAVLVGLGIIWATEIQTLAISLLAFAVALVIATKEIVLCLLGGMLKASTGMFTTGDRIEVAGFRGEVVDQGIMTTKLMEIGPGKDIHQYTGRTLTVPNALLLSNTVVNETATPGYDLHTFVVPIKADDDWREHERLLLSAAEQVCRPHIEDARASLNVYADRRLMDRFTVNPRVVLSIPESGRINLVVRVPTPEGVQGRIQRMITRKYLQLLHPSADDDAPEEPAA